MQHEVQEVEGPGTGSGGVSVDGSLEHLSMIPSGSASLETVHLGCREESRNQGTER
jgi:hypothetical protein